MPTIPQQWYPPRYRTAKRSEKSLGNHSIHKVKLGEEGEWSTAVLISGHTNTSVDQAILVP